MGMCNAAQATDAIPTNVQLIEPVCREGYACVFCGIRHTVDVACVICAAGANCVVIEKCTEATRKKLHALDSDPSYKVMPNATSCVGHFEQAFVALISDMSTEPRRGHVATEHPGAQTVGWRRTL